MARLMLAMPPCPAPIESPMMATLGNAGGPTSTTQWAGPKANCSDGSVPVSVVSVIAPSSPATHAEPPRTVKLDVPHDAPLE
jgi:hypothetical protein